MEGEGKKREKGRGRQRGRERGKKRGKRERRERGLLSCEKDTGMLERRRRRRRRRRQRSENVIQWKTDQQRHQDRKGQSVTCFLITQRKCGVLLYSHPD